MRVLVTLIVFSIALVASAVPAPAQTSGFDKAMAICPECAAIADELNALRTERKEVTRQLEQLPIEDKELAQQIPGLDEAAREAQRRGKAGAAAAAELRQKLRAIVTRRAQISNTLAELRRTNAALLTQENAKLQELLECERTRCAQNSGSGQEDGADPQRPDLTVQPVANSPGAKCTQCQGAADLLGGARQAFQRYTEYSQSLQDQLIAIDRQITAIRAQLAQARRQDLEDAWRRLGARAQAIQTEEQAVWAIGIRLKGDIEFLSNQLSECNDEKCVELPGTGGDPPGGGGTGTTGTSGSAHGSRCYECEDLNEPINTLKSELEALENTLNNVQEQQEILKAAAERAAKDPARLRDIKGQQARLDQAHADASKQQQQKAKQLDVLEGKRDDCNKEWCRPDPPQPPEEKEKPPNSTSYRLPLIGGIGGTGVLVALLAGGSDPPAAVATAPVVTSQPTTTTPPPPPVAQPTIAGIADCSRCEIMDDSGRHNVVINLCPQLTGGFEIAVASITIRHAAPFVDLVGAQYDQASGVFRGTTRGTVAGFPNVGIAVDGTANAATGEIRFLYTMGTGGELPGGRSITYAITLQKRR